MLPEYTKYTPIGPYDAVYCAHMVWANLKAGDVVPLPATKKDPPVLGRFQKFTRKATVVEAHDVTACTSPLIIKHIPTYTKITYTASFDVLGKSRKYKAIIGGPNECIQLWEELISAFWNIDVGFNLCWKSKVGDLRDILERSELNGIAAFRHEFERV